MKVAVIVPDEYMGDVIGDINARRGQIQGTESRSGTQQIDALVPLSNMFGYATDLRSKTQGPRPVFHGAQPLHRRAQEHRREHHGGPCKERGLSLFPPASGKQIKHLIF